MTFSPDISIGSDASDPVISPEQDQCVDLDRLLSLEIQRPARYLGKEFGAARKPWPSATVRWILSYPELYEVGASNLGHIILYNILNAQLDQLCDRVYLPGADLIARLRERQIPLFGVESRRPVRDFHIVGFSLAYELGGTNVLEMLDLSGIPLTWADRQDLGLDQCPLIFAGGPTASSNPEPFAEFFDFFALGDGEDALPEIGQVVAQHLHQSRREVLMALAQVPGVYVPQFYQGILPQPMVPGVPDRILRRVSSPRPEYSVGLVPYVETVHDRLTMEVRRGCTRGCRFCQPGMLTRPARDVDPDQLVDSITQGLQQTGYDEFSLASLSCSDYLSLPALGARLQEKLGSQQIALSLPSQRVDRFDDQLAEIMGGSRRPSLTFAPEAGTQRLRDIINKGLTDADLIRGITTAARQGWNKVKLYFMIGLPGETDADVIGIAHTMEMLKRSCAEVGSHRIQFTLTISNFTPKPHTPFQWFRVDYDDIIRKQALLKQHLRGIRGVRANFTDVRFSILEDLIGKGDRRLSAMIRAAWETGAGMDSWWENIDVAYAAWVKAYGATGEYASDSTSLPIHTFALEDPLPWDHLDTGILKSWLKKDYQRALEAMTVPDCSFEGCSACGICGSDFGHNIVLPPAPVPAIRSQKWDPKTEPVPAAQRFRLVYGKLGDLRWLGHLDLMRLWDRACRRAGLPVAFTGGYHPTPKIAAANALPMGYASRGEVLDIELTALQLFGSVIRLTPEDIQRKLTAQLPDEIQIVHVQEIPLHAPSGTQSLIAAEYALDIRLKAGHELTHQPQSLAWESWVKAIRDAETLWLERTTKSGRILPFEARSLLYQIACEWAQDHRVTVTYRGCCRNDGTFLAPRYVVAMLQQQAGIPLELIRAERLRLLLEDPQPDPILA